MTKALKKAFPDIPSSTKEKREYLKRKGIPVDAIGTSEEAVEAWFNTIDCHSVKQN